MFIAGQVAEDATGQLVGPGDFATQASQVFTNLGIALKAAGVRPNDVAKISIYVVDLTADHLPLIERARAALFDEHKPTDVLLGIDTLAHPGCLIEVEAIAVTDTTEP